MPEKLLASGEVVETPPTFRMSITFPFEWKEFMATRGKKFGNLRGDFNMAAYVRSLVEAEREEFLNGTRNGKAVRRARR